MFYNPSVVLAWQANMDIQFVLNAYAMLPKFPSVVDKCTAQMLHITILQMANSDR